MAEILIMVDGDHDGGTIETVKAEVVASWDEGAFVENLAVAPDGFVFVSIHNQNAILRYDPQSGILTPYALLQAPVAGLAFDAAGTLWAAGGEIGSGMGLVWRVTAGEAAQWAVIQGAQFINGIAFAPSGRLLVADSILGAVYVVRTDHADVSTWLQDERLQPRPGSQTPGANGIKLFGGRAVISVTDRNRVMRVAIGPGGESGLLEDWTDRIRADDMAFDANGSLYVATHPMNSVVRLAPDGDRTTLAGPAEGLVGATAVAFGQGAESAALYVTTTGGILSPFEGTLQRAKLVKLEIGIPGAPMPYAP